MVKINYPFCSIIILNYFGQKVIKNTIQSLLTLNYPKKFYEIIIVDNCSKDRSKQIILKFAKKHKLIKTIFLKKNLGFAGGNNEGIKKAKGKYVILLNNDCIVNNNWLTELVKTAEKDKNIFSVNSKIFLYPKYFLLKIKYSKKILLDKFYLYQSNLLKFTNRKKIKLNLSIKKDISQLEIPYDSTNDKKIKIFLSFNKIIETYNKNSEKIRLINLNKNSYKILTKKETKKTLNYLIEINTNLASSFNKIQNAGIFVFQDGYGRDIGSIVKYQNQDYEIDNKQYNKEKEIYASCGAACLYRKKILEKIGFLDDSFFMYYEDVEICERARFFGYKTLYCPSATVHHLHALSSAEWSPFFIYQSEKGRLLHILYHFPFKIFLIEYIKFFIKNLLRFIFKSRTIKQIKNDLQYLKIITYFLINLPILLKKRCQKHKDINKNLINKNYQTIKEGFWLFN